MSIRMSIHTAVIKFLKSYPKIDSNQNTISSLVSWNHFFSFASFKIQVRNLAEILLGRLLLVMLCWMTSGTKQLRFDHLYSVLFPEAGGNGVHFWMWSKSQPKLNLKNQQKIMQKQVCYPVKWGIFDLTMCFLHLKKEKFW